MNARQALALAREVLARLAAEDRLLLGALREIALVVAGVAADALELERHDLRDLLVQELAIVADQDEAAVPALRKSLNHATDGMSRWFVGSSSRSTSGRWNRRPASTPRIFQPPENSPMSRCLVAGREAEAREDRERLVLAEEPLEVIDAIVQLGEVGREVEQLLPRRLAGSGDRLELGLGGGEPARRARCGPARSTGSCRSASARPRSTSPAAAIRRERRSARVTLPSSTSCSPAMILSSVVLPEPFGPIRPIRSPWPSRSDAASKITRSAKNSVTSSRTTKLMAAR